MVMRRMAYRLPEEKFKALKEKLDELGIEFEEFIDQSIDLYLSGEINPKKETDEWGDWMET